MAKGKSVARSKPSAKPKPRVRAKPKPAAKGRPVRKPRRTLVIPPGLANLYALKRYAPGVKAGNLLFVSGMLGRDRELRVIPEPEAQFVALFENIGKVLEEAGAGFADVIDMTGYFTRLAEDFATFQAVKDRYIAGDFPAMTAIGVASLSTPGLLCELKCTAVVSD